MRILPYSPQPCNKENGDDDDDDDDDENSYNSSYDREMNLSFLIIRRSIRQRRAATKITETILATIATIKRIPSASSSNRVAPRLLQLMQLLLLLLLFQSHLLHVFGDCARCARYRGNGIGCRTLGFLEDTTITQECQKKRGNNLRDYIVLHNGSVGNSCTTTTEMITDKDNDNENDNDNHWNSPSATPKPNILQMIVHVGILNPRVLQNPSLDDKLILQSKQNQYRYNVTVEEFHQRCCLESVSSPPRESQSTNTVRPFSLHSNNDKNSLKLLDWEDNLQVKWNQISTNRNTNGILKARRDEKEYLHLHKLQQKQQQASSILNHIENDNDIVWWNGTGSITFTMISLATDSGNDLSSSTSTCNCSSSSNKDSSNSNSTNRAKRRISKSRRSFLVSLYQQKQKEPPVDQELLVRRFVHYEPQFSSCRRNVTMDVQLQYIGSIFRIDSGLHQHQEKQNYHKQRQGTKNNQYPNTNTNSLLIVHSATSLVRALLTLLIIVVLLIQFFGTMTKQNQWREWWHQVCTCYYFCRQSFPRIFCNHPDAVMFANDVDIDDDDDGVCDRVDSGCSLIPFGGKAHDDPMNNPVCDGFLVNNCKQNGVSISRDDDDDADDDDRNISNLIYNQELPCDDAFKKVLHCRVGDGSSYSSSRNDDGNDDDDDDEFSPPPAMKRYTIQLQDRDPCCNITNSSNNTYTANDDDFSRAILEQHQLYCMQQLLLKQQRQQQQYLNDILVVDHTRRHHPLACNEKLLLQTQPSCEKLDQFSNQITVPTPPALLLSHHSLADECNHNEPFDWVKPEQHRTMSPHVIKQILQHVDEEDGKMPLIQNGNHTGIINSATINEFWPLKGTLLTQANETAAATYAIYTPTMTAKDSNFEETIDMHLSKDYCSLSTANSISKKRGREQFETSCPCVRSSADNSSNNNNYNNSVPPRSATILDETMGTKELNFSQIETHSFEHTIDHDADDNVCLDSITKMQKSRHDTASSVLDTCDYDTSSKEGSHRSKVCSRVRMDSCKKNPNSTNWNSTSGIDNSNSERQFQCSPLNLGGIQKITFGNELQPVSFLDDFVHHVTNESSSNAQLDCPGGSAICVLLNNLHESGPVTLQDPKLRYASPVVETVDTNRSYVDGNHGNDTQETLSNNNPIPEVISDVPSISHIHVSDGGRSVSYPDAESDDNSVEVVSSRYILKDAFPDVTLSFSLLSAANMLNAPIWEYKSGSSNIQDEGKQKTKSPPKTESIKSISNKRKRLGDSAMMDYVSSDTINPPGTSRGTSPSNTNRKERIVSISSVVKKKKSSFSSSVATTNTVNVTLERDSGFFYPKKINNRKVRKHSIVKRTRKLKRKGR